MATTGAPNYEDVKIHVVEYVNCHRNKNNTHGDESIGNSPVCKYRSTKSWGSWFGTWWHIEVDVVLEIDLDEACPESKMATRKERINAGISGLAWTVGRLADIFPNVRVRAVRTGPIWPSFLYMDHLPVDVMEKGPYWKS